MNFAKFLRTLFFERTPPVAASGVSKITRTLSWSSLGKNLRKDNYLNNLGMTLTLLAF